MQLSVLFTVSYINILPTMQSAALKVTARRLFSWSNSILWIFYWEYSFHQTKLMTNWYFSLFSIIFISHLFSWQILFSPRQLWYKMQNIAFNFQDRPNTTCSESLTQLFAKKNDKTKLFWLQRTFSNIAHINPLLPNDNYSYRIIKISLLKKRDDHGKKFLWVPRLYESVDDEILGSHLTGKRFQAVMG